MSSRVTRSSARLSAAGSSSQSPAQPNTNTTPARAPPSTRKRKAAARETSPEQQKLQEPEPARASASRRTSKRVKVDAAEPPAPAPSATSRPRKGSRADTAMSSAGPSSGPSEEKSNPAAAQSSSRRKTSRKNPQDPLAPTSPSTRRSKKQSAKPDEDVTMRDDDDIEDGQDEGADRGRHGMSDDSTGEGGMPPRYDEDDDDDDPFGGGFLGRPGGPSGLSNTLRALSGMMSGMSSRLRNILENLRQKDDPSVQLIALQELSEILLVSTEDNLAGHFPPDQYVKELVSLMQPNDFGEENPEIMLLACRCIANLMEALPAATANVVYGGAVPILCQKLLEIHFIDLAEQALSTLEKISVEFPASIVREGGLNACLTYLDFFPTSTQRTAVTTAANCCRNIPEDCFPTVRDVMPILLNVLNSSDQRVVEQGCYCVSRIVESFKYQDGKLEELVSPELLQAILRLLLPGTTNLIGQNIHTLFLRVLSITARASPRLSVELFKMKVVDTLYQILTGVSPPDGTEDIATKIDSVVIMQALIHRPREQVFETLNVICELLPNVQKDGLTYLDDIFDAGYPTDEYLPMSTRSRKSPNDKRLELLDGCKEEVRRFAIILLPTLTDAYSSTVNLSVRQKVLTAQLKMLSNLDEDILKEALRAVPYASYLASILSQQDHPSLVTFALQAAELLLKRLESIYRYQFYREGVISEISRLADRPTKDLEKQKPNKPALEAEPYGSSSKASSEAGDEDLDREMDDGPEDDMHSDDDEENEHDDHHDDEDDDDDSNSSSSSGGRYDRAPMPNIDDIITLRAKKFMEVHETDQGKEMREKALTILEDLKSLAQEIKTCYSSTACDRGEDLFVRLAEYFDGDALESITSYELLTSGIGDVLLELFADSNVSSKLEARTAFLEAFMGTTNQSKQKTASTASPITPFSILVSKLQDLLSRAEHFEVITVHQNTFDSNRSSAASMLAKQLRLKLVADDDSGIPRAYRNIMVSIHAIATFKALDDYLRPRIALAERPRPSGRARDGVSGAIAAYAAAIAGRSAGLGGRDAPSTPPLPAPADGTNRASSSKRTTRSKAAAGSSANPEASTPPAKQPGSAPRRSSRKRQGEANPPPPPPPPAPSSLDDIRDPLECADEAQLSDEDDLGDGDGLDAIVDDLEDEMDEDLPDPSAVSVEVASNGRATAHKEDGTRVATPLGGSTPSSARAAQADRSLAERMATEQLASLAYQRNLLGGNPASARPMSYAAAIQAVPQDWHIEFSVNDQPISNETTIYRAVHMSQADGADASRNIWSPTHTIKFKKATGPPPAESSSLTPPPESASDVNGIPQSLNKNPTTSSILRLLSILHELNANLDDVLSEKKDTIKVNAEPLSQFVNTKLTAKLNRQLEEPLIVASNCLPNWSEDLARLHPFLFPFETRHLFLQSTSFGYSRSMARWQNAQSSTDSRHDRHRDERPFLGRVQRQKVRISRNKILESAVKVMELYGSSPSVLEVEYFEEVGTGLGPTLEFYSTVSKEFSKKKLKLWRENESNEKDEFAFGKRGLFPAPMSAEQAETEDGKKVLHLFKILGKFVARSMLDSRIIDVSFNPTFFRIGDNTAVKPSLGAVKTVDSDLARALVLLKKFAKEKKKIDEDPNMPPAEKVSAIEAIEVDGAHVEDLGLDFTLPGYPNIELVEDGANTSVTIENVGSYVDKVLDITLGSGVQKQVDAFRTGFSQVFPYSALRAFTSDELVMLFGRTEEDWTLETLMDSIKADHGYNLDSKSVRNLLQVMSELDASQRRDFLQFVTGSPKLPIGGFKALTPMFTVVCKPSEPPYTSDDYLPSVMTCVNYLKMPDYSSLDILKEKLFVAIKEGQGAFHLS
ncbi:HECT domain-containing protein [Lasiodiplodia theobromae]|uniref:HECT-type E3 ubiquitin transferase n=1 Tax=Lasiodiplodia theobromae TaxID=45133 RepID=A0A5N5DT52_9PEZI|nr:HECT domain-containing protein [Lasiodiplodia theobromae]KAB2580967.1 E3 ubiquitin-protein ligase TRIP12 [Lasiodiplodia theobromae]KAF4537022.1 HECT domain-containing protein [Lasiodiplodia theobromae]